MPVDGGYAVTISRAATAVRRVTRRPTTSGACAPLVGGETRPVVYAGSTGELSSASPHTGGLRLGVVGSGRLRMLDRKLHATVHAVDVADDLGSFTVTGYAADEVGAQLHLALVSDQAVWEPVAVRHDVATGRFEADFDLTTESWGNAVAARDGWLLAPPAAQRR